MRRYRCPDCRLILTTRPIGYLDRFQASVADIRGSLAQRSPILQVGNEH